MKILSQQINPTLFFMPDGKEGGGGKGEVHIGKEAKEFMGQFAPPPGMMPARPKREEAAPAPAAKKASDEAAERLEARKAEAEQAAREGKPPPGEQKPPVETPPKKGSFLEKQLEAKRLAESEREAALTELKTFKEVEVPKLNSQIEELQKKIDSGSLSSTREKEYEAKIQALEKEKAEGAKGLHDELKAAKERLSLYDLRESEEYIETYVKPMGEMVHGMARIVSDDPARTQMLDQALLANQQSLQATSDQGRKLAEQQRDELVDAILEGWPQTTKRRFGDMFEGFIKTSERQAVALANHHQTQAELRKKRVVNEQESSKQILRQWRAEFEALEPTVLEDLTISKETSDRLKSLKYTYDPDEVNQEIDLILKGQADIPQAVKVIRYGQAYHAVKAKNAALVDENKALRETVEKLKGSGGGGGTSNSHIQGDPPRAGSKVGGKVVNEEGMTREEWQRKRFGAGKVGV